MEIRKSTIDNKDSGNGVFAARAFAKGELIGIWNGSEIENKYPQYDLTWKGKKIHCYPLSDHKGITTNTNVTMGMQMINDPNWPCAEDPKDTSKYNVKLTSDLLISATRDIVEGEELFLNYNFSGNNSHIETTTP